MTNHLDRLADVALLVVYGAVVHFFFSRAFEEGRLLARRLASVGVALTQTGWILVAVMGLGLWSPGPIVRALGSLIGLYLLTRVRETQKKGKDE